MYQLAAAVEGFIHSFFFFKSPPCGAVQSKLTNIPGLGEVHRRFVLGVSEHFESSNFCPFLI